MASVLPELLIRDVLQEGLNAFKADQTIIKEVFSQVSKDEMGELVTFFKNETITLRIGKPPRGPDYRVPLIVIESVGEDEVAEQDLLGDFLGDDTNEFTNTQYNGIRLRSTHNIIIVAKDNRQARYLYRTVVAFLILYRYVFELAGFQNRRITGNKDVSVDLGADFLEGKMMTITGEYWFSVGVSERLKNYSLSVQTSASVEGQSTVTVDSYSSEG